MKISKSKLRRIILEELKTVRCIRERKKRSPFWRLWDDPEYGKPEKKKVQTIVLTPPGGYPQRSEQLNRQLQYLWTRKDEASIHENFIILDDARHILYVFEPNKFKLLHNFPVITGKDAGDDYSQVLTYTQWLKEENRYDEWKEFATNVSKSRLRLKQLKTAGGPAGTPVTSGSALKDFAKKHKQFQKMASKLFWEYLKEVDRRGERITPAGVYTIEGALAPNYDKYNYGIGIFPMRTGIDDPEGSQPGFAIHGTGNPGRIRVLKIAQKAIDRGHYNVAPVVKKKPSYGCINLENKHIKILSGLIREGSQVFILPEDGTINKIGQGTTAKGLGDVLAAVRQKIGEKTSQCFDQISDFFTFD